MDTHDLGTATVPSAAILVMATMAVLTSAMRRFIRMTADDRYDTDRGAVSIEQVLWYAAAAISVAVVAAIVWSQIRTTASTPVQAPSAP
jgi:hypothetical protein